MSAPIKREYDRTSFILVVDDDNTLLKFFKIHLNKFFSKVIVVQNGKEAMDTIKEKQIDLVISDVRMPKVDGGELLAKVRTYDPLIPVLLISGATLTDEQQKACQDADGFLAKPFGVDDLNDFINRGMRRRELLVKLGSFITKKKDVREVALGKGELKKSIAKGADASEAAKIVEELRNAG